MLLILECVVNSRWYAHDYLSSASLPKYCLFLCSNIFLSLDSVTAGCTLAFLTEDANPSALHSGCCDGTIDYWLTSACSFFS